VRQTSETPAVDEAEPGRDDPSLARSSGGRHEVVRIIARRVPWLSLRACPDRSGLRPRWDALTEAGELLTQATEYPLADGAHVLAERGISTETLVTMRHEVRQHDSFKPMPLRIPAGRGARRAEESPRIAARLALGRERTPEARPTRPTGHPDAHGLPLKACATGEAELSGGGNAERS
jgi:hypothetical protein